MKALLSFDTEEFDVPREKGVEISLQDSMRVSREGTLRILDVLRRNGVKATFFCTANFVREAPDVMRVIIGDGHEVASHGVDHWHPQPSDVEQSKIIIEQLTGCKVTGYRQPRMFPVSELEIARCGYLYNSSLNPTFIPGKYMHLNSPRRPFMLDGVLQIPASVTPWVRFPLFWLSYHHLPGSWYRALVRRTIRHEGYFTTYFHPWEFYPLGEHPEFKLNFVHARHSGPDMAARLDLLIKDLKRLGAEFTTFTPFAREWISKNQNSNS